MLEKPAPWWAGRNLLIHENELLDEGKIRDFRTVGEIVYITTWREFAFYNKPETQIDGSVKYPGDSPRYAIVR